MAALAAALAAAGVASSRLAPADAEGARAARSGNGALPVAPGSGPTFGRGRARRFIVEVERGAGVDPSTFAAHVEAVLSDPRGWTAGGGVALRSGCAAIAAAPAGGARRR